MASVLSVRRESSLQTSPIQAERLRGKRYRWRRGEDEARHLSDSRAMTAPLGDDADYAGRERLLIVDDEHTLARLWVSLLETLGYQSVACFSAAEALTAFRNAPAAFDLVITDLIMPDMTGVALARELLRIRPDLPIILCTGFSNSMTQEEVKVIGIRAYLEKPLGRRDLARAIRSVLD
jgi:CheY-like chemotaxis protein